MYHKKKEKKTSAQELKSHTLLFWCAVPDTECQIYLLRLLVIGPAFPQEWGHEVTTRDIWANE